tara:strand:+ start:1461 stop:2237 length:777 start_codon:yes stop_codon:yes gene_type:complete
MVLCLTSSTAAMAEGDVEERQLKRTVLVEERTAIWCPSCAEIDPELAIVAKSHGTRTAIVGLHVDDAFENEASLARIEYQKMTDNSTYGTPTFFVDGVKTAEGYDAWNDVQQRILSQENSRGTPEELAMVVMDDEVQIPTPEYGQITLMVVEHDKEVPAGVDNPGEDVRDRVLVGMKVIDSNGNVSEYGNLQLPELWSLIMIHEPVEGGSPYGVVEISNIQDEEDSSNELLIIVAFCILLGGLVVFIPEKKSLNSEEE